MPTATLAAQLVSPESHSASGKGSEKLSLPSLQSKMKCDPEGYETELNLLYRHFDSSLHLFRQQSALSVSADPAVSKDLGDMSMFLAHVTPCYPERLADFPGKLIDLLSESGRSLLPSLRTHLTQALILLVNRKIVGLDETLRVFMELQTLGDRNLRKLAFTSVVQIIRRMNQKHKDEAKNRKLQSVIFSMLQKEDELKAKRALVVLCDLHRRKVWFDDRTANAICTACFHSSSKVLISTLSFLLGYEEGQEEDDSDGSSSEDESTNPQPLIALRREDVYKANQKGTTASKKKKKAKLQRIMRSLKRQQRRDSGNSSLGSYTPLTHLKDPQGFAEKLFSCLQKCNERFEVRMMMLKLIARTLGLHRLILSNFFNFLQRYAQPHQRDVTSLLAAGVQACHDMVPPDEVEPFFRQVVNQFVHDRSRPEAIAVGLNVVREICMRVQSLMTEDLLQDLVLYKKSHEKAVSTAARSLITLFRELCPSFLVKKDRGRPTDPKAKPKEFGEVTVMENVPGLELLEEDDGEQSGDGVTDDDEDVDDLVGDGEDLDMDEEDGSDNDNDNDKDDGDESDDDNENNTEDDVDDDDEDVSGGDDDDFVSTSNNHDNDSNDDDDDVEEREEHTNLEKSKGLKRKFSNYEAHLNSVDQSLRALKKMAYSKTETSSDQKDGILSNEDFARIRELKEKQQAKHALIQQGLMKNAPDSKSAFKIPSSESLSTKRVDPAKLEINIRKRMSKEERLALVKAGREDRGKYLARAAVKQKKTGGLSNRQKEHKKAMPLAAKKAKVAKSRQEKKKMQRRAGKQFRGKKAWK